jgi:hypothetical protein
LTAGARSTKLARMLRKTLTYANVTATLALFVALGGVGYAAVKLPSNSVGAAQIKKNAVSGAKVTSNSLTGADIKESTLAKVPSAANADHAAPAGAAGGDLTGSYPSPGLADGSVTGAKVRDGSLTGADIGAGQVGLANVANDLHQTCPAGTHYYMGACFDVTARAPAAWASAEANCEVSGGHLPSPEDLYGLRAQPWTAVDATTGEWTGHFWTDNSVVYVELIAATGFNRKAILGGSIGYRCALPPLG